MNKDNGKIILGIILIFIVSLSSVLLLRLSYKKSTVPSVPEYTLIKTETPTGDRLHYIDKNGEDYAVLNSYSTVERTLDENGRTIREMYYFKGNPVALPSYQYGDSYAYNKKGQLIERTYLDQNGNPMIGFGGFAVTKKTYDSKGNVKTEKYYDTKGKPIQSTAGDYGKKYIGKLAFSLNKNGHIRFDIVSLSHQIPGIVILFSLLIVLVVCFAKKPAQIITLGLFLIFILSKTLLRESRVEAYEFSLFRSYRRFFADSGLRVHILNNIWLFVPFGAAMYSLKRKPKYLFIPIAFSVAVELIQLFFHCGLCEADDVISNALGACIGFVFALVLITVKERLKTRLDVSYENLKKAACRKNA